MNPCLTINDQLQKTNAGSKEGIASRPFAEIYPSA
jgi:hypothetical protein